MLVLEYLSKITRTFMGVRRAMWEHRLVGLKLVSRDGSSRETWVAGIANPASDLLELDSGPLVPSVFVVESAAGRIVIDPPDGLFEVFES